MSGVRRGTAVVTIVRGRRDHLVAQHASLDAGAARPEHYVVVSMGDEGLLGWDPPGTLRPDVRLLEADPAALPLAAARNVGAEAALAAGATCLVFLDVDCLAGPGLVTGYAAEVAREPGTLWSGPVTYLAPAAPAGYPRGAGLAALDAPHPSRPALPPGTVSHDDRWELFWSLSFALDAAAWRAVGGFYEDYTGYGGEDTDFAQLARAAGLVQGWCGTPRAYHQHHPVEKPPVRHAADIVRNAAIFHERWGWWPMGGWLEELTDLGHVRRLPDGWALAEQAS